MADLRQFRQFVAVAEELSFRRAAERLHMAQPPLTTAIRRLEEEVGARLLERDNRIHRLTPAGRAFLDEARRTLAQAERTLAAARSAASGRPTLRLSFVDSTINLLLPRILQAFRQGGDALDFQLQEDTTAAQLEALREDRTDAGLIVLPVERQPGLHTHQLVDGEMRVALPEGHPLAHHANLRLEQLAGEPWLLFPRHHGPGMHDLIASACAEAGFVPNVVQQARQMQTIAGLVAGGIGVALVPSLLQPLRPPGVVFRPLRGRARIPYRLALAYRTPSALVERFREVAQAVAAEPSFGGKPSASP
ncbi:LysR family transcriptional regulator [Pseudomonas paraeruginosa]|uniref:LysR family transcriptional regulator n=1 Tax=Pseudomonas aeruginosa group TaxID=136841 RepID=UPI00053ED237|nr:MULTISPECIES: LysR family transcriptional regulator [Pseudomonas aeruginosa group]KAB0741147.1 LysR family transcriptional regulator [Pseudomonas aeruginosa]MBG4067465.1 LysR family transcriptional regulator [Pseudomonas aeruginosa]MBH3670056.1 LysR family transcriptional regulator [Pseudomonas aeruginosa]MBH9431047.1 LysR family transcriptional regulator [Pseudomonas aeruginosa]MBI8816278.1 LysR family transcriptional regulator [Pseudomonas aeruginosa]